MSNTTVSSRRKLSDRNRSRIAAFTRFAFNKRLKPTPQSLVVESQRCRDFRFSDGVPEGLVLLVSTSSGIYLVDTTRRTVSQLTQGKTYGMTKCGQRWLFTWCDARGTKKSQHTSHIFAATLAQDRFTGLELVATGIPNDLHQIDVFQGRLWVPHTGYNQVLSIPTEKLFRGKLNRFWNFDIHSFDIRSPSHLNSIYFDAAKEQVLLVAHNHSRQTSRSSEVLVCDSALRLQEIIDTGGHSVHNVCRLDDQLLYCDSGRCSLMRGGQVVHKAEKMVRGLSISEDCVVVGGSDVCFDRNLRFSSNASLYFLDHHGAYLGAVEMPATGDLYEIRRTNGSDAAFFGGGHEVTAPARRHKQKQQEPEMVVQDGCA